MKTNTMRSAGSIRSILFLAALQLSPSIILAAETPKEIVTTQGYFSLTENGLPEQKTIPALFDELDYQGAVQAYLWAMPQMTVAGQHHSNKYYGAKSSTDFLYMYKDPSVLGMLTPNTIVEYIVNFYNFGKGTYSLTLWHREEQDEDDGPSDEGFALSLEQKLTEKIIPFVRYSCSDGDSTKIQQLISTGVGLIDTFGREGDVAGIGLAWGAPSDKSLQDQYTMESFYRFQVRKHFQITPGFQLIVNPSNEPDNDVVGIFQIRARITF